MDDLISRQAAIDAVRKAKDKSEAHRMLVQLPSALPSATDTNVGGNLIDRQAALNSPVKMVSDGLEWVPVYHLRELPPAQPECEDCIKHGGNVCPPCPKVPECEDAVPRTSVEYICRKNTVSTNPYEHKYHDKFIQFMDDPEISDFGRWKHSNGFNTALVAVKCDLDKLPSVTPSAQPGWIPCSEKMPPDYQWYYATCKSLVDNRENWVVEGCYTPWEHFDSTPMIKCGDAEVIAWMPKEFPEPWERGQDG